VQLDLHSDAGEGYSSFSDSDADAAAAAGASGGGGGGGGGRWVARLGAGVEVWPWDAAARGAADAGALPELCSARPLGACAKEDCGAAMLGAAACACTSASTAGDRCLYVGPGTFCMGRAQCASHRQAESGQC